ncbi:MAG TPA: ArsA family ATPase [Phycisphaerae bacterium]|nr:ArsA family ATPase [Phycisphaerae bacterium]
MRIILFTGKGGVGKSTIAAATAVRTAMLGRRTLLVSSDMAHNLSDITAVPIGHAGALVAENLHALEVDILAEIRENWAPIQQYMADIVAFVGLDGAVAEEVAMIPGMDAVFVLTRILREIESNRFDTIIVDCAPTAGALRLLTFTDCAAGTLNFMVEAERKVMKLVRPAVRRFKRLSVWMPEDATYRAFEDVVADIGRLGGLLKDPEMTSVRLVLNPDRIAVAESRRAYTYFGLFGFPVDGIFVNRVFPDELEAGYLDPWRALQEEQMAVISRSFLDTAVFPIRYLAEEPIGVAQLDGLGAEIYGDAVPDDVLSATHTVRLSKEDGKLRLMFSLPNLDRSSLDIQRKGRELLIAAGGHSRVFALPDTLAEREVEGATYTDGDLVVSFAEDGQGAAGAT